MRFLKLLGERGGAHDFDRQTTELLVCAADLNRSHDWVPYDSSRAINRLGSKFYAQYVEARNPICGTFGTERNFIDFYSIFVELGGIDVLAQTTPLRVVKNILINSKEYY